MDNLPQFDLVTGGFPCQTFSMMGKQAGFNEDRGQMFFHIIDILAAKMPRYVLLENVKNLRSHDKGRTFARIKQELEALGYQVFTDIFNTAQFHLPQTRNRLLILRRQNLSLQILKCNLLATILQSCLIKYIKIWAHTIIKASTTY